VPQVEKYAPRDKYDSEHVEDYQCYILQHIAMNLTRIAVTHALVLEKLEMIATIMDEATSEDDSGSG
jgi:hypothetical protein